SKVAVFSRQEGIDPVGACVGLRGIRIQNIVNELNGERIDVVQWDPDPARFVANALSPAQVNRVKLIADDTNTAEVVVADRQLSLAIGKEGQNARLAAKLTGLRIDIKSLTAAEEDDATAVDAGTSRMIVEPEVDRDREPPVWAQVSQQRQEAAEAEGAEPETLAPAATVAPERAEAVADRPGAVRFAEDLRTPVTPLTAPGAPAAPVAPGKRGAKPRPAPRRGRETEEQARQRRAAAARRGGSRRALEEEIEEELEAIEDLDDDFGFLSRD
ncbi:MAG TPA: hypothetical protein VH951_01155, partial [Dehalococcoidia bacterium]